MALTLYDLALADSEIRPSPYCWRVKFALLHKGLQFDTVPLRFTEKDNYPDPEYGKLPILRDGDQVISDSANIIAHLEKNYAGEKLTATAGEQAAADFFGAWAGAYLLPVYAPLLVVHIHAAAHDDDKEYYRATREKNFGKTLEELAATPDLSKKAETVLQPLAAPLARYKFLGGEQPNLSDYTVFSYFMWQRSVVAKDFCAIPQAVDAWRERMLDLFDGYGRKAKTAA